MENITYIVSSVIVFSLVIMSLVALLMIAAKKLVRSVYGSFPYLLSRCADLWRYQFDRLFVGVLED